MSEKASKRRLDSVVRSRHQLSWNKARGWIATGKIWVNGIPATDPSVLVDGSIEFELKMNAPRHAVDSSADIVFVDAQVIVLNKPAGMNTVPFDETEKDSLEQRACRYLKQARVVVVQRIDRETSGLVVFARTQAAGQDLSGQFRSHSVLRRYFALAHGEVKSQTIRSMLVKNKGNGLRGSIAPHTAATRTDAKLAITHVTALATFGAMTLVECQLETGRTHQIRIHLSEVGHPLLGEKAYNRYYTGPELAAPRIMLHAAELGFTHPVKKIPMRWALLPPADFLEWIGSGGLAKVKARLNL